MPLRLDSWETHLHQVPRICLQLEGRVRFPCPPQKSLARALRFGLGSMIRLNPILDGFLESYGRAGFRENAEHLACLQGGRSPELEIGMPREEDRADTGIQFL